MTLCLFLAHLTSEPRETFFIHDTVTLGRIKTAMTSLSGDKCGNFDVKGEDIQLKLENGNDFDLIYAIGCDLTGVVVEIVVDLFIATNSEKSTVSMIGSYLNTNVANFVLKNSLLITRNRHP